jgi:RP/EB family microtubule-associated protein
MVMETLYPDAINRKKVVTDAKLGHDILKNFKLLQSVLEKKKIDKVAPVDSLMRMKYQDNLEFLQWIKCFHERQSGLSAAMPLTDGQSASENRRVSKAPRAPLGATGAHLVPSGRPSLAAGSENTPPKSPKGNSSARAPAKPQRPSSVGLTAAGALQEDRAVQSAKETKRSAPSRTSLAPKATESSFETSERLKALEKTAQDMSVTVL